MTDLIMKVMFDVGYYSLLWWMRITKNQIERETGWTITEFDLVVSPFSKALKTEILVNGEPFND